MKQFLLLLTLICLVGCSAADRSQLTVAPAENVIIHPSILAQGGEVFIIPFSAGPDAFASDDLDRAALIIQRGIQDGLTLDTDRFEILSEIGEQMPDLVISGRIEQFETKGNLKRFVGGQRYRVIKVTGKVVDENGVVVAMFQRDSKKYYQEMSEMEFLLSIGKEIGMFLTRQGDSYSRMSKEMR